MKLEVEITEDEIKSAVERKIRVAVADQANQWRTDEYIKSKVKEKLTEAIDSIVATTLAENELLKTKVAKELERKIRGRLEAAMRLSAKTEKGR